MERTSKLPPEVRERAVHMVQEHREGYVHALGLVYHDAQRYCEGLAITA